MSEEKDWHPPLTTRRQRKTQKKRWHQRNMEMTPGHGVRAHAAHFFLHFLNWAAKHGAKCGKHVWVCPRCYDCLACLHVEACSCGHFSKAHGARCVVATSLPRVNDGT